MFCIPRVESAAYRIHDQGWAKESKRGLEGSGDESHEVKRPSAGGKLLGLRCYVRSKKLNVRRNIVYPFRAGFEFMSRR